MKGLFITFEGIENCGKTTQINLLKEYFSLNSIPAVFTREPGGTLISEKIRQILLDNSNAEMLAETEMLLYMASRSQHTGQLIIPSLNSGKMVVSDRYYDSTIAYQGAARRIERKVIDIIREYATYGAKPDLTFLIDIPVELSLFRMAAGTEDRIESESCEFHKRVREGFLNLAEEENRFIIIDGTKSIKEIHREIVNRIKTFIDHKEGL